MDWTYLGHAGWHVVAERLRFVVDPLLHDLHHGGTYEVWPRREIDAAALRPDFVLVSHAHPDHFDVRSLRALARLDPDTIVVTPDPFVADVARRLGFRDARALAPATRVALDGASVVLTPSLAPEPECGFLFASDDGAVWDQVDTVLGGEDDVRRVVSGSELRAGVDLALVRWQPLLEIEAQVPGSLAFPLAAYARLLGEIAAIGARAVVPAAAGQRHAGGAAWLDAIVSPVSEARFLADLSALAPATRALPGRVGGVYRLRRGAVHLEPDAAPFVRAGASDPDPRAFRGLEIPPAVDPSPASAEPALEALLLPWLEEALAPALARALPTFDLPRARLGLEVVFPTGPRAWLLDVRAEGCSLHPVARLPADLDALDVVTATGLADVLEGRRGWGDVLLAGELRASLRAYRVGPGEVRAANLGATFLYYAAPYAESMRRATLAEVEAVLRGAPPPWATPRG